MNRYLKYTLVGFKFKHLTTLEDNHGFMVSHDIIKSITVSNNLDYLIAELHDGVNISDKEEEIDTYLNHICFNLILDKDVEFQSPYRKLELFKDEDKIETNERLVFKDCFSFKVTTTANDLYNNIINNETAMGKHFLKYERIFKILHNPSKVIQFLSLYEFLKELLSEGKDKVEQKNVTDYFKVKNYKFISFKKTRRDVKYKFCEDSFTYLRNELAHCESTNDLELYRKLGSDINNDLIRNMLVVLNDIIVEL